MTSELFVVGVIVLIIGGLIGWALWYWKNKETEEMQKILNDPELLIKKLKAHGKIYDRGCPITIDIEINEDKKKVVVIKKGEEIKSKILPKTVKAKDSKKKKKKRKKRGKGK